MLLNYLVAGIIALIGCFVGFKPLVNLSSLNKKNILNILLGAAFLFTCAMAAYVTGYLPEHVAAGAMVIFYSFFFGFFAGFGWRLYQLRKKTGQILYIHRSFWSDFAPAIAATLVILFGIYRTSLLLEEPVTAIRLTSGLSLISFGLFGWTIKIIPEFRSEGIVFLDRLLPWKQIIAWEWSSEEVLTIEYLYKAETDDEQVKLIHTTIPVEDRKQIENVLDLKMQEHQGEREKLLLKETSGPENRDKGQVS